MALCVAVIAKENYPLYIRSVSTQSELKFHYTVHTSLDVVEEKISAVGKAMADQRELYLGLLYPTEDYKVYGYVTNSKVKFVIVVDSSNTSLRDNEIRSFTDHLHRCSENCTTPSQMSCAIPSTILEIQFSPRLLTVRCPP
ncbi:trafficking protein particle complex subunit 2-like protein isoform X1 [Neoarius graeffei]|uniref:trafficking protein particle complex subunit 2-like protein isoform X1 n=1 Tax=Neoarius graeffei TaxID=443677 RepID=UPI00298C1E12|nr:trafficking protein particle complex subunit 2-like protein isoform X1 [Neoarius graeffei]